MAAKSEPTRSEIKKANRRRQILAAAMRLVRRHGTQITTAQIAREANCSKETLYNWFEDRDGIFLALVEEQGTAMGDALSKAFASAESNESFEDELYRKALILLDIATGDAIIVINRIAIANTSENAAAMGRAVLDAWRTHVINIFAAFLADRAGTAKLEIDEPRHAYDCLAGLLIGDRQRRLLLGESARPSQTEMPEIAAQAVRRWLQIYGV